jgi:hypothetical protein
LSEVAPEEMKLSHDSISRWLSSSKVQPKDIWEAASKEIDKNSGILAFDDVVIDKSRSEKMELVRWQYSGTEHGIVKGIGVVNVLWQTNKDDYTPIDYRIWNPPDDGKTKNDHFREMLSSAKKRGLEPEMVVADIVKAFSIRIRVSQNASRYGALSFLTHIRFQSALTIVGTVR